MMFLAIALTLAWGMYGSYCAHEDKSMVPAYLLGLLDAVLWCFILNLR